MIKSKLYFSINVTQKYPKKKKRQKREKKQEGDDRAGIDITLLELYLRNIFRLFIAS